MERSSSPSMVETSREVPRGEHSASSPASPLVGAATSSACKAQGASGVMMVLRRFPPQQTHCACGALPAAC